MNPMELLEMTLTEAMAKASCGNPGALQVLLMIHNNFGNEVIPLSIAMIMTESKGSALWVLFRYVCNDDIQKTQEMAKKWYDNEVISLDSWMEGMGWKQRL